MKTALCYFSGTGNSYYIAKKILEKTDESQLLSIPDVLVNMNSLMSFDKIGIIFPVHGFGLPKIVRDFIKNMGLLKNRYIFTVVNYGHAPFNTIKITNKQLKRAGLKLNYSITIKMPTNYFLVFPLKTDKETAKIIQKANQKIAQIAFDVNNCLNNNHSLLNSLPSLEWLNNKMTVPSHADKNFIINSSCISCGFCKRVCPVKNIEIVDGSPIFKHNCQFCMGCIHLCPKDAIDLGEKTKNKRRYKYFKNNGS